MAKIVSTKQNNIKKKKNNLHVHVWRTQKTIRKYTLDLNCIFSQ